MSGTPKPHRRNAGIPAPLREVDRARLDGGDGGFLRVAGSPWMKKVRDAAREAVLRNVLPRVPSNPVAMRARARRLGTLGVLWAGVSACSGGELPDGESRKSQPAVVRQRMGATELAVVYNRPAARGRALFGGIVPFGEIWNPGADEATRIEIGQDVRLEGQALPAGRYSIWAIPGEDEWTLIFSRAHDVPHVPYPEGEDALRVRLRPRTGPHTESLGFDFPLATADSALLQLRWGTLVLPVRIKPGHARR